MKYVAIALLAWYFAVFGGPGWVVSSDPLTLSVNVRKLSLIFTLLGLLNVGIMSEILNNVL